MKRIRTLLLPLLALPLAAQGFSVTGSLVQGLDSLKKATNATTAFMAAVDYDTRLYGTEVPARAGLAIGFMPGQERFGLKTSLMLYQLHGDIRIATPSQALSVLVGLSMNTYTMSNSGTENTADALDVDHHFPMHSVKGVKLGLRLGLDYRVSRAWSVEVMLQQTELAGKDLSGDITDGTGTPLVRQGGINPAWVQFGATYRF